MAEKTTGRIVSTKNVEKNLTTASSVFAKHTADGATSFLKQLEGEKWEVIGPTIGAARDKHEEALDLKRQMEEAFSQRDLLMKPIVDITNRSKKLLKGKYATNPKKLGEWGYDVDDTPPRPRTRAARPA